MGGGRAGAVAFLLGVAMMGLELTAVRLLAPHFGDSAYVWTNVIGVMLVALAAGAWLGGAMAGGPRAPRRLATALGAGALLAGVAPLLGGPLGAWLVPQDLPLEAAMAALVRGSLVATSILFAPPVLLLGCASPMLVAALVEGGVRVGRASGLVNASSTIGSLLGTFLATHLLVPTIGSRAAVWACAAVVAVCAALVARRSSPLATALPALLVFVVRGPLRVPADGQQLLAERESAYQFLQVVRQTRDGADTTMLKINEGLDSFHSLAVDGTAWTGGAYYDWHTVAPILARDGAIPEGRDVRVLSLGAAAGTFARLFAAVYPGCRVDGVEIDPAVIALGERFFGGRQAAGADYALDARVFVERCPAASYDVVLVDTYVRQIYVPAHVASVEFFTAAERCLRPGGVVSVNSGGWSFEDPVVQALGATMKRVFGAAYAFAVPWSRNFVLVARKAEPLRPETLAAAHPQQPDFARVLAQASRPGAWQPIDGDGPVLTDDCPRLDGLQHEAMRRAHAGGTPALTAMAGTRDPNEVAEEARAALVEGRAEDVLAAVRSARAPTPYLRLLAGDARWARHDVAGAHAEFEAAIADASAGELAAPLQARAKASGEFLSGLAHAEAVGLRNGRLLWGVGLGFLMAFFAVLRRTHAGAAV
ncbi:MAG: fused MFS/spermidine synthase [Planctomycetota bacterium]